MKKELEKFNYLMRPVARCKCFKKKSIAMEPFQNGIANGIFTFRKKKLFGVWHKTQETGSSGATLLLHNTLRAFKFPDESQVYLKCDIEVSNWSCTQWHRSRFFMCSLFVFRFVVEHAPKPFAMMILMKYPQSIAKLILCIQIAFRQISLERQPHPCRRIDSRLQNLMVKLQLEDSEHGFHLK